MMVLQMRVCSFVILSHASAIDSLVEVTHWRRPPTNLRWPKFDPTEGPSPLDSSR
jgi:hypothetical protein